MAILDSPHNMILILATAIPCAVILVVIMGALHCVRKRQKARCEAAMKYGDSELGMRQTRAPPPIQPGMTINTQEPQVRRFETLSAPIRPQNARLSRHRHGSGVPSNGMLSRPTVNGGEQMAVNRMSSMLSPTLGIQNLPHAPLRSHSVACHPASLRPGMSLIHNVPRSAPYSEIANSHPYSMGRFSEARMDLNLGAPAPDFGMVRGEGLARMGWWMQWV